MKFLARWVEFVRAGDQDVREARVGGELALRRELGGCVAESRLGKLFANEWTNYGFFSKTFYRCFSQTCYEVWMNFLFLSEEVFEKYSYIPNIA